LLFSLEIFTGGLLPLLVTVALVVLHQAPALAIPAMAAIWYGLEWAVAASAGWPISPMEFPVWILRDTLIPAVWLAAYASRGFVWRSTRVEPNSKPVAAPE
jgi:ceramide glucosyltransferase